MTSSRRRALFCLLACLLFWRITGILERPRSTPGGLDPSAWGAPPKLFELRRGEGRETRGLNAKLAKARNREPATPLGGDGQNDSLILCVFLCTHGYRYGCDFVISWDTSVMQIDDEQALPGGLVQGNGAAKQMMLSSVLHGVHHRLVRAALYSGALGEIC